MQRMLRQIFRQRGAYNVVNLPYTASQDDPGGCPGRADRSLDWRRNYNPAAQPEFREDVGLEAWKRPDWYEDKGLSSTAAAKILRKRLEIYGPQRERNLQEVIQRVRNEKDAEMALKAAELFRRYRSSREQHTPFKNATSKMIIKANPEIERALAVNAGEVVLQALERKDELGLTFYSLKAYREAITHFSQKRDLKNVLKARNVSKEAGCHGVERKFVWLGRVFELAKQQGMNVNRDIAFCIVRACLDCKRADLAYAYGIEFQHNGIRLSPAQKTKVEAEAGKLLPPDDDVNGLEDSLPTKAAEDVTSTDKSAERDDDEVGTSITMPGHAMDNVVKSAKDITSTEAVSASTSSTGELEVSDGTSSLPAAAISENYSEGSGVVKKAVAVASVEVDPDNLEHSVSSHSRAEAIAEQLDVRELPEQLDVREVPGLQEAVAANVQFFPKKVSEDPPLLRRAESI